MKAPLKSQSRPGVGLVVVGQKPNPNKNKPLMDLTAAVFFDGTGNNRANVNYRLAEQRRNPRATQVRVHGQSMPFADSYGRGFSNIAILEYLSVVVPTHVSVYIGGAGAPAGQGSDMMGNGFGVGATGIPAAVTRAIREVTGGINKKLKAKGAQLGKLRVDVFGFSRGAAAARHFVARRTNKYFSIFGPFNDLCTSLHVGPDAVVINFVGLYDTVSSYGGENKKNLVSQSLAVYREGNYPFADNVQLLHLAIGGEARYVAQLAAGDEYRKLFPRTTIDSSVNAGHGFEYVVPGAHGDVGGGYDPLATEEYTAYGAAECNRLVREGWFKPEQLVPEKEGDNFKKKYLSVRGLNNVFHFNPAYESETKPYVGTRQLTPVYQFLTLGLMMVLARKHGVELERFNQRNSRWQVPPKLKPLYQAMRAFMLGRLGASDGEPNVFVLTKNFRWVRHQYLHLSAIMPGRGHLGNRYKEGMVIGAREIDGAPVRQIISDDLLGHHLPAHYKPQDYLLPNS